MMLFHKFQSKILRTFKTCRFFVGSKNLQAVFSERINDASAKSIFRTDKRPFDSVVINKPLQSVKIGFFDCNR